MTKETGLAGESEGAKKILMITTQYSGAKLYKAYERGALDYLLSTKETAYVTARPAGIPASLKNWIHSEVA